LTIFLKGSGLENGFEKIIVFFVSLSEKYNNSNKVLLEIVYCVKFTQFIFLTVIAFAKGQVGFVYINEGIFLNAIVLNVVFSE
jgi:hypothetical protein